MCHSVEYCQRKYPGDVIPETMTCAGRGRGRDACDGDSGSPLTYAGDYSGKKVYTSAFKRYNWSIAKCRKIPCPASQKNRHFDLKQTFMYSFLISECICVDPMGVE